MKWTYLYIKGGNNNASEHSNKSMSSISLKDSQLKSPRITLHWENINVNTPEPKGAYCGLGKKKGESKHIIKNGNFM